MIRSLRGYFAGKNMVDTNIERIPIRQVKYLFWTGLRMAGRQAISAPAASAADRGVPGHRSGFAFIFSSYASML